ncbi:TIM44-like domain-containing protein [Cytophaga aurantiaca]|uniref:TIM44-like domain-containing protein n=1 Tax=Cytophaga aurantiaca TaxID=29530 RepID=UPI00035F026D|nr:TIM44-like domain-containing protein [Cytophaga aurantiaca]
MKFKSLFKLLLFVSFLLLLNDVLARAGGGHGGGGGHSSGGGRSYTSHGYNSSQNDSSGSVSSALLIIIIVVVGIVVGTIPALLKLKSLFAAKIITHASNKDSVWNADELKKHTEKIFYAMQKAWESRNMDLVKKQVTVKLYEDYKLLLAQMLKNREKNMLSFITIDAITIIGSEDFKDDSKDRFVAYIKGTMLDYTINERSNEITENPNRDTAPFSDTYHFVRNNNTWLLEEINNTVRIEDIVLTKNFIEK